MRFILPFLLTLQVASGFVLRQTATPTSRQSTSSLQLSEFSEALTSSSHSLALLKAASADQAKGQFFFFLFAGSGAGGIGIMQIPKILAELKFIRELSEKGPTAGGDTIDAGPFVSLLYPKQLAEKDVLKAMAQLPTSEKIVASGKSTSYFATKGYVVQEDFLQSLKGCNPLASFALFQAIAKGSGKCVSPVEMDEKREEYKQGKDLTQFVADYQGSAMTRLSSYAGLAFLLFVTFDLIIETGIQAFM